MTDAELHVAWDAVHENTPDGWCGGRPGYEERYNSWTMYAFDPSETPVVGKRSAGGPRSGRPSCTAFRRWRIASES